MFAQNALLADSNPDLINLYRTIQRQKTNFINQVQNLADKTFVEKDYYEMRTVSTKPVFLVNRFKERLCFTP